MFSCGNNLATRLRVLRDFRAGFGWRLPAAKYHGLVAAVLNADDAPSVSIDSFVLSSMYSTLDAGADAAPLPPPPPIVCIWFNCNLFIYKYNCNN